MISRTLGRIKEGTIYGRFLSPYILYLPMSSGSRLSSHFCSRSESPFSGAKSTVFALSMTAVLDEDRRPRPQRQRDRVARPRVDRQRLPVHAQVNQRVEGVLLQVGDDDLLDVGLEIVR